MKPYRIIDCSHLLGMAGISDTLLKNHFTLYQGYVNNTNNVMETLEELRFAPCFLTF
jgi:superoxide dismutase, Fe-Mn family